MRQLLLEENVGQIFQLWSFCVADCVKLLTDMEMNIWIRVFSWDKPTSQFEYRLILVFMEDLMPDGKH